MDSTLILKIAIIAYCFPYCLSQSTRLGSTRVTLDGSIESCRSYACNFGNLIVDAMNEYNMKQYKGEDGWTDAAIAMHNSGSVAASIPKSTNIYEADVHKALPYNDTIVQMDLTGKIIREMLEHSVNYLDENNNCVFRNAFLHFAGLLVDYDLSAASGSRINCVSVRCAKCIGPEYEPLKDEETYKVLTTDFIANGGDGYTMLKSIDKTAIGVTVDETVMEYVKNHDPVWPGVERRITFLGENTSDNMKSCIVEKSRDLPTPRVDRSLNENQPDNSNREVYGAISIIFPLIVALIISI